MSLNVAGNYSGHLSGLFYTGAKVPLPPALDADKTWRIQRDDTGYDAQYYRLIAHDPLNHRGFIAYLDNQPLRWRRIGLPALAALLSAGNDGAVDAVYVLLQLGAVFLGAFCLARYAQVTGLAFLLLPAVLVSLDRMTTDLALAALVMALICFAETPVVYAIAIALPLVRETGLVVLVAWCLWLLAEHRFRRAALLGACAIPALLWWLWVAQHTSPDGTPWLASWPFSGLVAATLHGWNWHHADGVFEALAIAGIWLAFLLTFYRLSGKRKLTDLDPLEWIAMVFTLFAALLGKPDIWDSAYATGRTMSPLLLVLALLAFRHRKPLYSAPLFLILPRIALQYEAQLSGALRSLL